jgi:hypothetical protein
MVSLPTDARRLANRLLLTITALGITAVGCEAPTDASAGGIAAPSAPIDPNAAAGADAAIEGELVLGEPVIASSASHDSFFDERDEPRLEVLRHGEIVRVERGSGGRSVGFRLTFADGSRGYFKPEQTFSGASDVAEVAAYHLDRLLGFGRVPPTTLRVIPWSRLEPAIGSDPRAAEVTVRPDGTVRGSLSFWIEEPLVPIVLGIGFERWFRLEPAPYLTPFQRPRVYLAQASGTEPIVMPMDEEGRTLPFAGEPDREGRGAELSDLVVFDHLLLNTDRWGGGFTNVRMRGRGGPLVFLDQGGGLGPGMQEIGFMDRRLAVVQRFRQRTIESLRALELDALCERLDAEGYGPLLDARRFEGLEARRAAILTHVEARIAIAGESDTLAW